MDTLNWLDVLYLVLGGLLWVVGLAGCFLPVLPGPPLAFVGLLLQQLRDQAPFSTRFLLIWLLITITVTVLDYWIPIYGTKKLGGTRAGVWGATIGLVVGFFLGPWGIIIGPFFGALLGELLANQDSNKAWKAAFGSFVGFLLGTVLKLAVTGIIGWHLFKSIT
jgi:uncharacterized protein YqgC (DUF456 family)